MQEVSTEFQSSIDEILEKKKKTAKNGEKVWNKIKSKMANKNDYVLLFPDDDDELLKYGMIYMDSFALRNSIDGICVCTNSEYVKKNIDRYSSSLSEIFELKDQEVEDLIQFYSYFPFEEKFDVISLTKPHCRDASQMVGKNGITKEQLVAIGIYKLIPFEKIL